MYWRYRNIPAIYTWLSNLFTPKNETIQGGDTVHQALEKAQGQIDGLTASNITVSDPVTPNHNRAVQGDTMQDVTDKVRWLQDNGGGGGDSSTFICLDDFGAVGDGLTDDASAIQNCFNSARDNNCNIIFGKDKIYASSAKEHLFYGGILEGNNSTILSTYNGDVLSVLIRVVGTVENQYLLDVDAMAQTTVVRISDETFLNNLSIGDVVNISSTKDYSTDGTKQGEIAMVVKLIEGGFKIAEKLNDTYKVLDSAYVMKLNTKSPVIRNLNIIHNKDIDKDVGAYGIMLHYCKNSLIENCNILYAKYGAYSIIHCYKPIIRNSNSSQTIRDGLGYGVSISGATTSAIVTGCRFTGARHSVAHGGSSSGVPHNSYISNVVGENCYTTVVFDAHGSCGKVTWENCTAIGGYPILSDAGDYPAGVNDSLLKGEWDNEEEYLLNELVTRSNLLFYCKVTSSIGEDPLTSPNWDRYINDVSAFATRASQQTIINCQAINCTYGIKAVGFTSTCDKFIVKGLHCTNVQFGIKMDDGTILTNSYIDNLTVINDVYSAKNYLIYIKDCSVQGVKLGKFVGKNIRGVIVSSIDADMYIDSIECDEIALFENIGNTGKKIAFDKIIINSQRTLDYNVFVGSLSGLYINTLIVQNPSTYIIIILNNINSVQVNSIFTQKGSDTTYALYISTGKTLDNLLIGSANFETSGSNYVAKVNGTLEKSSIGIAKGIISTYTVKNPILEILAGNYNYPSIVKGDDSPEGIIAANVGTVYFRRNGGAGTSFYIKENGTEETGWIPK